MPVGWSEMVKRLDWAMGVLITASIVTALLKQIKQCQQIQHLQVKSVGTILRLDQAMGQPQRLARLHVMPLANAHTSHIRLKKRLVTFAQNAILMQTLPQSIPLGFVQHKHQHLPQP